MDATGFVKALESLLENEEFTEALNERPTFWSVIEYGRGSYEIRYSKMLRWLLDPAASHGLGSMFLGSIMNLVDKNAVTFDSAESRTQVEWNYKDTAGNRGSIDIIVSDPSAEVPQLLAIENKMYSGEHYAGRSNIPQSVAYRKSLEEDPTFSKYKRYLVYLTPEGKSPADESFFIQPDGSEGRWYALSYHEIELLLLECEEKAKAESLPDTAKIIWDFRTDIHTNFFSGLADSVGYLLYKNWEDHPSEMNAENLYFDEFYSVARALGLDERAGSGDPETDHAFLNEVFKVRSKATPEQLSSAMGLAWRVQPKLPRGSVQVQEAIRKLYNLFVKPEDQKHLIDNREWFADVAPELGLPIKRIKRSKDRGMGISIYVAGEKKDEEHFGVIRFQGDKYDRFPQQFWFWRDIPGIDDKPVRYSTKALLEISRIEPILELDVDKWFDRIVNAIKVIDARHDLSQQLD